MSLQTESSARRVFDGPASQPKETRVPSTTSSSERPAALRATLER